MANYTLKLPGALETPEPQFRLKLPGVAAPAAPLAGPPVELAPLAPPPLAIDDPDSLDAFEFLENLPDLKQQERGAQAIRRQAKAYESKAVANAFATKPNRIKRMATLTREELKERGRRVWMGKGVTGDELEEAAENYADSMERRLSLWNPRFEREYGGRQRALEEMDEAGGVNPPGTTYPTAEKHMPMVWGPEHGATIAAIVKETGKVPEPDDPRKYGVQPKKKFTLKESAFKQPGGVLEPAAGVAGAAIGLATGGPVGAVGQGLAAAEVGRATETGDLDPMRLPKKAKGLAWEIVSKYRRPGRAAIDTYAGSLDKLREITGDLPPPEGQDASFQWRASAPMVGGLSGGQIKPQVFAHHYPWSGRVLDIPVKEAIEKTFFELEGPRRLLAVAEAGLEYGWEALTTDDPQIAEDMATYLEGIQKRYHDEAIGRAARQLGIEYDPETKKFTVEGELAEYSKEQILEMVDVGTKEAYDQMIGSDMLPLSIEHPHVSQFLGEILLDPLLVVSPKKGYDVIVKGVKAMRRSRFGLVRKAGDAIVEGIKVGDKTVVPGAAAIQKGALEGTAGVRHMSQLDPLWLAGGKYEGLRKIIRLSQDQAGYGPHIVEKAWETFGPAIKRGERRGADQLLIRDFADGAFGSSRDPEVLEKVANLSSDPKRVREAMEAHLKFLDIRERARGGVIGLGQRWGYRPKIAEADFELANAVRKKELTLEEAMARSVDPDTFQVEMETWRKMQVPGQREGAELLPAAEVKDYMPRRKKTPEFEAHLEANRTSEKPKPKSWLETLQAKSGLARQSEEEALGASFKGERWDPSLHAQWEDELYGSGRWIDLAKKSEVVRRGALYAKSKKVSGDVFLNEYPKASGVRGEAGGYTRKEMEQITNGKTSVTGVKHMFMDTGEHEVGGMIQRLSGTPGETTLGGSWLVMPEPLADHFSIALGEKGKFGYVAGPGQALTETSKFAKAFWDGWMKPVNRIARTIATIPRFAFAPRNAGSGPQLLAIGGGFKALDPGLNKMTAHLSLIKAIGGSEKDLARIHPWANGESITWRQLLREAQEDRIPGQLTQKFMYSGRPYGPIAKGAQVLSDDVLSLVTPGGLPVGFGLEAMKKLVDKFPKLRRMFPGASKKVEDWSLKFRQAFSARAAASITEDYQHLLGYIAFRNGNSMMARANAVELTDRYMYLYHRMAPIEKSFFNETFYFYNWISKSFKNNVKSLADHPYRMSLYQKTRQNMEAAWGAQVPVGPDAVPKWLQTFGVTAPPSMQPGPFRKKMGDLMDEWKLTDPNDPNKRVSMLSLRDEVSTRIMFDFTDAMGLYVMDLLQGSFEGSIAFDRNADASHALTPSYAAALSIMLNAPSDLPAGEILAQTGRKMLEPAIKPWAECARLFRNAGHDTIANEIMGRYYCYRQWGPLYQVADEGLADKGYFRSGDLDFGVWPMMWTYPFIPSEQESFTSGTRKKKGGRRSYQLQKPGLFEQR